MDKSFRRNGVLFRLYSLSLKLGSGPTHAKMYAVRDWEIDQVQAETLQIPTSEDTEFTFNVDLEFKGL